MLSNSNLLYRILRLVSRKTGIFIAWSLFWHILLNPTVPVLDFPSPNLTIFYNKLMSWKNFIQFFILVYILIGIKFGNIETENITIQDKNTKQQTRYFHRQISNYLPGLKRFTTNCYININFVLMNQQKQNLKIFQYS